MAMHEGEEGTEEEVMPGLTEEEAGALAQQLYVAYYGRPADPVGLAFWTGEFMNSSNLDAALAEFGTSAEYSALSADKTSEELLTSLYQQMFNRDPDMAGLEFYVGRLESGEATLASIAKQVADGAVDEDATTLANKVAVANAFTAAVEAGEDAVVYDAAGISAAAALLAAVDGAEGAVAAGEAAVADLITLMDGGMEYTLVATPRDLIESGYGDDTFTGTSSEEGETVQDTDAIRDAGTKDHDTLTITNSSPKGVQAISVHNVEYINIIQDLFDGVVDDTDGPSPDDSSNIMLANVKGAKTVTISSEKLGYDHRAYVSGVYDNTLVAGDGVTKLLIVGDLADGTVDLGSVENATIYTIAVDPDPDDDEVNDETGPTIIINGDVELRVKGSNEDQTEVDDSTAEYTVAPTYTLMVTADATVSLNPARSEGNADDDDSALVPFEVAGAGSLTLMMDSAAGAEIANKSTGDLMVVTKSVVDPTDGTDVSKVESSVTFSEIFTGARIITAADGQMIVLSKAQEVAVTIMGPTAKDMSKNANLTVTATDLEAITFADAKSATLTVVGAGEEATKAMVNSLSSATIPVSVISSLEELTVGSLTAARADFSGVDGKLTIDGITVDSEVTGGSGANKVILVAAAPGGSPFDKTLGYTGGADKDSLVVADIAAAGRVEAHLGAGNDSIVVHTAAAGARFAIDGGAGHDALVLQDGANIAPFDRLHTESIEVLAFAGSDVEDDPDTDDVEGMQGLTATVSLAQLAPAYIVSLADSKVGGGDGADSVDVTVNSGTELSIDLSHLVVLDAKNTSFLINALDTDITDITDDGTKAATIVGSGGGDVITGTAFAGDTLTGGGGADTFVFADDTSYRAADAEADPAVTLGYDTITDFSTADGDEIDLSVTTVTANLDLVAVSDTEASKIFSGAQAEVQFQVKDGVLTLDGLRADKAMADTLEEWLLLAQTASDDAGVIAFQFGGDTYVLQDGSGAAGPGVTDNLIKLEGVTGITLANTDEQGFDATMVDPGTVLLA